MRVLVCLVASLTLHAALLGAIAMGGGGASSSGASQREGGVRSGVAFKVVELGTATLDHQPPSSASHERLRPGEVSPPTSAAIGQDGADHSPSAPLAADVQADTNTLNPNSGVLGFNGERFFPTALLNRPPQPTQLIELDPALARTTRGAAEAAVAIPLGPSAPSTADLKGRIVLSLWIDSQGKVVDITREHDELPAAVSDFVERAFKSAEFVAGEKGGKRVGSVMRIEVKYDPQPK